MVSTNNEILLMCLNVNNYYDEAKIFRKAIILYSEINWSDLKDILLQAIYTHIYYICKFFIIIFRRYRTRYR